MKTPNSYQLRTYLLNNPDRIGIVFILCLLAVARKKARGWIVLALLVAVVASYFAPGVALLALLIAWWLVAPLSFYAAIGRLYWTIRR